MKPYPVRDYPYLTHRHLQNTVVYPSRYDLIQSFANHGYGTIAEVGVALGDFSKYLIETIKPSKFVAIDMFRIHEWETLWGKSTKDVLGNQTHRKYYENALKEYSKIIDIREGASYDCLAEFDDKYFDLIYIDADHEYENVKKDAEMSIRKIKDGGVIVFNDYMMYDHLSHIPYGVVYAANEVIVREDYEVLGFALGWNMFCDLAVRKRI